nr:alpha/beta hydrolase-fold protein [uncultured Cellulosilyticum sp.]
MKSKKYISIMISMLIASASLGGNILAAQIEDYTIGEATQVNTTTVGVDVSVETITSGSINQTYTIKTDKEPIDLSKLEIRYYFTKSDEKAMHMWCDNAAVQLNIAPWYKDLTNEVNMSIEKDSTGYYFLVQLEDTNKLYAGAGSVTITTRFANSDWSAISDFAEIGIVVRYDGNIESSTTSPVTPPTQEPEVPPTEVVPGGSIYETPINPYDVPNNFASNIAGTTYGTLQKVSYYSTTTGKMRNCNVIIPAHYSPDKKYPVLYLLHGIGGTEDEWLYGGCDKIIGNLIASGEASEMIVVMPNVRAAANDASPSNPLTAENIAAFDNFINDLQNDLMPFIKQKYSIKTGTENTAIAGLSMGGRESLFIGFSMRDTFGYIGAFSPAPGLLPDYNLNYVGQFTEDQFTIPQGTTVPKMILICNGNADSVVGNVPTYYHETLAKNGVDHFWYTMGGDHNFEVWNNGLYHFCQRIFK